MSCLPIWTRRARPLAVVAVLACRVPTPPQPAPSARPAQPSGPARVALPVAPAWQALVAAEDRLPDDVALDGGRHPAEVLQFIGVAPGMRIAELGAGGGYTTELVARALGGTGELFAQNDPAHVPGFSARPWVERLLRAPLRQVNRVDRDFADPLPATACGLDRVVIFDGYHDLLWMHVDRAKMNRAIFAALRPGGEFVIIDHSARAGAAEADAQALHRVDEALVVREVEAAGLVLTRHGDFLRNPDDTRDWNPAPQAAGTRRGDSDRFALAFARPALPAGTPDQSQRTSESTTSSPRSALHSSQ